MIGEGLVEGQPVVFCVFDFSFMGEAWDLSSGKSFAGRLIVRWRRNFPWSW